MAEDDNPTRKEVLQEMLNGVKQYFSSGNLRNVGSKLKKTGQRFLEMVGYVTVSPYILPTIIRGLRDVESSSKEKPQFDATDHVGYSTGLLSGIALDVAQVMGYSYAVKHDHLEALLIPVVTNVASGIYEVGRSTYNNARQRISDRHKAEELETKLQTKEE